MRAVLTAAFCLCASLCAANDYDRLFDALYLDEVVSILAEEGSASARGLESSMFPGRGGPAWESEVDRIYAVAPRQEEVRAAMSDILGEADLTPILAFLESDQGARIMALEVSARRAFIDPEMEELATELFADAEDSQPELYRQVAEFTAVTDLVAQNVEGAFRSNAAFALGAHEAGAFPGVSVDQLIAQMWQGDDAVEAEVSAWLYAYLMTAYRPLPSEDLAAYIAFSETESGQMLNAAIMGAFEALFVDVSYDLGSAAGRFMAQQEL